ncbi:MAG TPA: penicillin-binding protein activator LpoB [Longimicrobiales bacterium]|nr:penicillin-binding protein activator LpoB [Longimicrobiales bacterium]
MYTGKSVIARRAPWLLALAAVAVVGCAKQVTRIDPDAVTDLSGRWNDTDSRLVANALIEQSMIDPWIRRFNESNGGDMPTVIVGTFRNESMEHIPTGTFVRDVERALIQSGAVRLVAARGERDEIRDEREDQQENARSDSRARLGQELGADYVLQGTIESIEDEEGREKIVFYQIDAYLTDLESNVRVWVGHHEIKKYIERPRFGR